MSDANEKPASSSISDAAHPDWFREPTAKELKFGIGVFLGFGLFFFLSFRLGRDWSYFRWLLLALGFISTVRGLWYLLCLIRMNQKKNP